MNAPTNSRTALITGASRGLGRAIAERLARDGWSLALVARQAAKLHEVRAAIEAAGGKASVHAADISDPKSADQVIAAVEKESGPLGALINNAGITKDGLVMRMEDADWCSVIDTNLTGAFRWIRAASRGMLKARSGRIVNIGSVVGLVGNAGQANYAAAKAGLIGLTKSVAREFASRGITCNCVCPRLFRYRYDLCFEGGSKVQSVDQHTFKSFWKAGGSRWPCLFSLWPRCRLRHRPGMGHRWRHDDVKKVSPPVNFLIAIMPARILTALLTNTGAKSI